MKLSSHCYPPLSESARKVADDRFRRELLDVHAGDVADGQEDVRNVGSEISDNNKVAIVTFLSVASKEAYNPLEDYQTIFPLTSYSMAKYAAHHGYKLFIHQEPFDEAKQAYWEKMKIIREVSR